MGFFKLGICDLASGGGGCWKGKGWRGGWRGVGGLGEGWGRVGEGLAFYTSKTPFEKTH